MKVPVYSQNGVSTATVELDDRMFGQTENHGELLHMIVTAALANVRNTVGASKTRGAVRGGGKKPWKQKGTGRARAGSIRSPLWRGGGVIFGPSPKRNFSKKVNRKAKRLGLFTVLSDRAAGKQITVLDEFALPDGKTKSLLGALAHLSGVLKGPKFLFIISKRDEKLSQAARNLSNIRLVLANNLNILNLLWADTVIILQPALPILQKTYLPGDGS